MSTTFLRNLPLGNLLASSEEFEDFSSLIAAGQQALEPEPRLTVSEWADEHRILPATSAEPGRWRTARAPYLRDIMDALSPTSPAEFVTVMKGSQLGCTEAGNNWIGYCIHHAPGLMLMVYPGLNEVKRNTSTRIDPLIEASPELRQRVARPRSRDSGNSMFRKKFPGGELVMTGANSAVGLRSTPARYLFLDEIDGYPPDADGEGDPVDLAERRTSTFGARRKIYKVSTPTVEGISRIQKAYLESDQRRYFVPCKHCHEFDFIEWAQIRWPDEAPREAVYECKHCGGEHTEGDKRRLLAAGEWRATVDTDGRHAGFHLPAMLSPFESWGALAEAFLRVKDDPSRFKVWVNTALGEAWHEKGEAPEWKRLYDRREHYRIGSVPREGLLLTCGVDVQADRLEAEVVAWDRHRRSWSVEYHVMMGDTTKLSDPVWDDLTQLLNGTWNHQRGAQLVLSRMAIDDGYNSQTVREWARRQSSARVMVVKGRDAATAPVGTPSAVDIDHAGRRVQRGMRVWPIAVSLLKSELYGWLRMESPTDEDLAEGVEYPPGYCHFPEYDEEYFKMLTAERLVKRTQRGYVKLEWEKTRERNEALDIRVMARAAAIAVGVDRWHDHMWDKVERHLEAEKPAAEPFNPGTAYIGRRRRPGRYTIRSSYMDR